VPERFQAREVAAEALSAPGKLLPQPNDDIGDVLTAFCALMLIRIEDLGGDNAIAELVSGARVPCHPPELERPWSS
jgi:hypothetical protein